MNRHVNNVYIRFVDCLDHFGYISAFTKIHDDLDVNDDHIFSETVNCKLWTGHEELLLMQNKRGR